MSQFPVFLSIIVASKNQEQDIESILQAIRAGVHSMVDDYEIVIVDNASTDHSVEKLQSLTGQSGEPNLQVYALTKEVDLDTAIWVGLENALGDFVVVYDPWVDDIAVLPQALDRAIAGHDVVFANNSTKPNTSLGYRISSKLFHKVYQWLHGINLEKEAPPYRILSRRMVNFILQHPQPAISYRHLPVTAGFLKTHVYYTHPPKKRPVKNIRESVERGIQLLLSTTQAPMRLVTTFSLFGAFASFLYSFYVVFVGLFLENVTPGWISISLQISGMFFLLSLTLLVLGEYILHVLKLSDKKPRYHIGQEFVSANITRRHKLNITESAVSWCKDDGFFN